MRSYPLLIDGRDETSGRWTYVVRASAFLSDLEHAFAMKRELELSDGSAAPPEHDWIVGRCALSTPDMNARALESAARAARIFGRFPQEVRRQFALDFHHATKAAREQLVEIMIAEGHPRRLAEWEVTGIVEGCNPKSIDFFFEQMEREIRDGGRRILLLRKPDGVVCVNPPQNAAGSNSALGVASLWAGNAVVVKAPRSCPMSVMFLYREVVAPLLTEHGAPPGTVNVVCDETKPLLRSWMESPLVDDVMFFGDSAVGLKVGQQCIAHGKKPILELSGNDAFVVWRDADLDASVEALVECFYGSSQICMVPKHAIVHPCVADAFVARLMRRVADIRPGYPEDPSTLLSPVLKVDRFYELLADAEQSGAEVLCGGRRLNVDGEADALGLFLEPTVVRVDGLRLASGVRAVREETFFPLLPVVVAEPVDDEVLLESVIDFMNANDYGLRNSLWTASAEVVEAVVRGVHNGGLLKVNESHIGFVPYLATHGGTGLTGGPQGELHYPILRTSHLQGVSIADGERLEVDSADTRAEVFA